MNYKEINELIKPYQMYYDQKTQRNYFFNTENAKTTWELPPYHQKILKQYYHDIKNAPKPTLRVLDKHLPREITKPYLNRYKQLVQKYRQRPARKQVQQSLANNYAYRDGDQQYNFWFNKFINDKGKLQRQVALTRCNPQEDIGYTKGDLFQKKDSYFCIHFAKGCCAMGINCKYYHRLPLLEECKEIENARDVFGRPRFSTHKENMAGVGCFMKDTPAIYVQDFRIPVDPQATTVLYQVILRHFHLWGKIQDINIIPQKGYAFVKYAHRCQAQYAKQAMTNQSLDGNQILTIKWAHQDPNPKSQELQQKQQKKIVLQAIEKKQKQRRKQQKRKIIRQRRERVMQGMKKNMKEQ